MRCDFCGKDDSTVERVFMDSGCQVGMNCVCTKCKETKYKEYLNSTGFEEIGTSDDYDEFTGRPQHSAFGGTLKWLTNLFKH